MEASASLTNKKVLVVDDNHVLLKALSLKLSSLGYEVLVAEDGAGAVSAARRERPDLILLDINFPPDVAHGGGVSWDGFLILSWLRRMEEVKDTPVIFISEDGSPELVQRAQAAGAAGFFDKSLEPDQLIDLMQQVLNAAAETVQGY